MRRTPLGELASMVGRQVRVCGWVDHREEGDLLVLRDRSGTATVSIPDGAVPSAESAVQAVGAVVARGTGVGLRCDRLEVLAAAQELPLGPSSPLGERLDWRFLDLRRPRNRLVLEVQTTAETAMRAVFAQEGFLEIHSPKLRSHPNKSGHELFSLDYFGGTAYLAQSPQLLKQMAMAAGLERIFEIGPAFRAHQGVSSRHATEFTSVDVEISWIDSHEDLMTFEERLLAEVVAAVVDAHGPAVTDEFGVDLVVPEVPFPRIPLEEARRLVEGAAPEHPQPRGDLDARGEATLGSLMATETGHDLVFVVGYPQSSRPYYHMRSEPGSDRLRDFDLLWKGMEVTTGAQREHRYDVLVSQARSRGVPLDPIRAYLDCFRFGCPPHGGFGLGLARALMALLGLDDIREATYLHRGADRLSP